MEINFGDYVPKAENVEILNGITSNCEGEERDVTSAQWALDTLEELSFRSFPAMPILLLNYLHDKNNPEWQRKVRREDKESLAKKVNDDPDVEAYNERYDKTLSKNLGSSYWLEEYIRLWLDWDERDNALRCWEIYKQYPETMGYERQRKIRWKKKKHFIPSEVEEIRKQFDGKVV